MLRIPLTIDVNKIKFRDWGRHVGFIVGTGRCGTQSYCKLLNNQNGVIAEHDIRGNNTGWNFRNREAMKTIIRLLTQMSFDANIYLSIRVYPHMLMYIDFFLSIYQEAKCICLKREKNLVVKSWIAFSTNLFGVQNYWTNQNSKYFKEETRRDLYYRFPHFDLPKRKAIEAYYDLYYKESEKLSKRYPDRFKIYPIDVLNNLDLQRESLEFIGVRNPVVDKVNYDKHHSRVWGKRK